MSTCAYGRKDSKKKINCTPSRNSTKIIKKR